MKTALLSSFFLIAFLVTGCGGNVQQSPKPNVGVVEAKDDPHRLLKDIAGTLRQAKDLRHYAEGVLLVNTLLRRNESSLRLDKEDRDFLAGELDAAEMTQTESMNCYPVDVHHLASCYLFHDAAIALELADAEPLERARLAFAWMTRRVHLLEQGDQELPAALILRRGYGNALERAMVFLEVLRALGDDGGLVTAGDALVVGVPVKTDQGMDLALFDPRLGLPVAGPGGKSVALLSQARKQPELLKASGFSPDDVKDLEVSAVASLPALSPRMRFLEQELTPYDKVKLYQNLRLLAGALSEAGKVSVSGGNRRSTSKSPLRWARLFYPIDEGGVNQTGRWKQYQDRLFPWPSFALKHRDLRLNQELYPKARNYFTSLTEEFYVRFYTEPEEFFLRGQYEALFERLFRLRDELEAPLALSESEFAQGVVKWRKAINEISLRLAEKVPGAEAEWDKFWKEDVFMAALLKPEFDVKSHRKEKTMLTHILFTTSRDILLQQSDSLIAQSWHEKAAVLQAHLDRAARSGKDAAGAHRAAADAWENARGAWRQYLDRLPVGPQRLADLRQAASLAPIETMAGLWEEYHRDLHGSFRARLLLADALAHSGKADLRRLRQPTLRQILDDLDKLPKAGVQKELEQLQTKMPPKPEHRLQLRFTLMLRDYAPQGNLHWLRESVRLRMRELDKQ